jgi:hypothetical protein
MKTSEVEISQKSVRSNRAPICRHYKGRNDWDRHDNISSHLVNTLRTGETDLRL